MKSRNLETKKALFFINGEPPKRLPEIWDYSVVACTDGAFHYLETLGFPFEKLTFVSGDFDSNNYFKDNFMAENLDFEVIFTPNQDKTDFEKALEILKQKDVAEVDVYGASGREMDHFLGNLTAAFRFKEELKIKFYDEFSEYFFLPKCLVLENVKGKMISLYPFPTAENIITNGLNWELNNQNLSQTERIGTRNIAVKDRVEISFQNGQMLVFIAR